MPHPIAPLAAPALFDVTIVAPTAPPGALVRVALNELELAPNARREIDDDSIERLAHMLMTTGQLVPCIGYRPAHDRGHVVLYAGQRRLLAARASHTLAHSGLQPIRSLIVTLLDYEPGPDEIRRIQAQENQREELTLADQQAQFADCWHARAALPENDRIAAVCSDLGIGPVKAHNLRRQLTLPKPLRARVAERPRERQFSATLANRLADMYEVAPQLTVAVAERISTPEHHDAALRDPGAFVHRTLVEDPSVYAVRIDDGARLDAHAQLTRVRAELDDERRTQAASALGGPLDELDSTLDALVTRAKATQAALHVDAALRERARTGRYAYVHDRGPDFAAGIWVIDPVFMLDALRHAINAHDEQPATAEPAYFAGASLDTRELRAAAEEDLARRQDARERHAEAVRSNLGLGHDLRAGLLDLTSEQLNAARELVCRLIARDYRDVIAYGAGWTDPARQRPVGETARHEPQAVDTIADAELQRALRDPDPLRGITGLLARLAAAYLLDPAGVTRTKVLGSERMARKLHDALPESEQPARDALWTLMRPMISPRLAQLHRDGFAADENTHISSVDLDAHRGESSLDDIDVDPADVPGETIS